MKKIVDELGVDQTAFDEPGPDLTVHQTLIPTGKGLVHCKVGL